MLNDRPDIYVNQRQLIVGFFGPTGTGTTTLLNRFINLSTGVYVPWRRVSFKDFTRQAALDDALNNDGKSHYHEDTDGKPSIGINNNGAISGHIVEDCYSEMEKGNHFIFTDQQLVVNATRALGTHLMNAQGEIIYLDMTGGISVLPRMSTSLKNYTDLRYQTLFSILTEKNPNTGEQPFNFLPEVRVGFHVFADVEQRFKNNMLRENQNQYLIKKGLLSGQKPPTLQQLTYFDDFWGVSDQLQRVFHWENKQIDNIPDSCLTYLAEKIKASFAEGRLKGTKGKYVTYELPGVFSPLIPGERWDPFPDLDRVVPIGSRIDREEYILLSPENMILRERKAVKHEGSPHYLRR